MIIPRVRQSAVSRMDFTTLQAAGRLAVFMDGPASVGNGYIPCAGFIHYKIKSNIELTGP